MGFNSMRSVVNATSAPAACPKMLTIRQTARTGVMPEHALRVLLKAGKLPVVYIGKKALINYDALCRQLSDLGKGPLS